MPFVYLYLWLYFCITANAITVNTNYGSIKGAVNQYGITAFKKIPFAKPPVDDLRWTSPQAPEPWTNVLDATEQDVPACLQGCPPDICAIESEDCLYLSIYTPTDLNDDHNIPVMIWLYGGSFHKGFNDDPKFDPSNIIKNIGDVIIVIPNYRVGILGFLYDNSYDTGLIGQYGFEDQLLAIKWVYENIENFGGDKEDIVLFGESSGAQSVALHLLYNNEYGYFKAGIMESPHLQSPLRDPTTWYDVPVQFTNLIGCNATSLSGSDLLDCWKAVDGGTIIEVQDSNRDFPGGAFVNNWPWGIPFTPTANTDMIPDQPLFEWQKGEIETPPFIIGTNKDESFFFIDDRLQPVFGYDELFSFLTAVTQDPVITSQILSFYDINPIQTYTDSYLHDFGQINTDNWICSIRNMLSHLEQQPNDIYYYNFEVINEELFKNVLWAGSSSKHACWTRNCHLTDMWYIFTPPIYTENDLFDNDTLAIGKQLQTLWTNYAKTLNPNLSKNDGSNSVSSSSVSSSSSSDSSNSASSSDFSDFASLWPAYTNIQDKNNFLQISSVDEFVAKSTFKEEDVNFCAFWDQVGYINFSRVDMTIVDQASKKDELRNSNGLDLENNNGHNKTTELSIRSVVAIVSGCLFLVLICGVLMFVLQRKKNKWMVVSSIPTEDCDLDKMESTTAVNIELCYET